MLYMKLVFLKTTNSIYFILVHDHKVLTSFKLKLKSEPEIFDILGEIAEHALYLDLQFLVDICCTDISNNLTGKS